MVFLAFCLECLKSYLQERPQHVIVNGSYSDPKCNSFDVPQGSVLGPLLFSLYYGPLEDVIRAHGIDRMMYADDCQLYIIIKQSNGCVALDQLELCIDDVLRWNTQNGLKCNPTKTEVIYFYSRYMPSDSISHLRVGTAIIEPVNEVRNLGITFDSPSLFAPTSIIYVALAHYLYTNSAKSGNFYLRQTPKGSFMPLFPLNWTIAMVCFTPCPLLKYRNVKDYKTRPPDLLHEQKNLIISLQSSSICSGSL